MNLAGNQLNRGEHKKNNASGACLYRRLTPAVVKISSHAFGHDYVHNRLGKLIPIVVKNHALHCYKRTVMPYGALK